MRTHSAAAIATVEQRIAAIAHGVAEATGTRIEVSFKRGPDAVINDAAVTRQCMESAADLLGGDALDAIAVPSMGGEDFSEYLARVPGCLFRLGVAGPGKDKHFLHSPRFDLDETALAVGAKLLARCAVRLAAPH
jgi:amidohydrolase